MKILILSFITMISFQTLATNCPDLAGEYTCFHQDGRQEILKMDQKVKNGVTIYNFNGDDMTADGQLHTEIDGPNETTYSATCQGSHLDFTLGLSNAHTRLQLAGNIRKALGSLIIVQKGTHEHRGQKVKIDETIECN